jgi:phosphatidylglycerol:prolipoprotein diacylglycerol transferase
VHPEALQLGPLTIHWYGILLAVGFLLGVWTAGRRGLKAGLSPAVLSDLTMWLLAGGILGARVLHVVTYWEQDFVGRPISEVFAIWKGGLVFYGGLIGAALAGTVFAVWKKLPWLKTADVLAPSIALGSVFGRLGCLTTGCCYGGKCEMPWAIRFPVEHQTGGMPVHPTQLYDSFANLVLYVGLAWLYRRRKFDGQVFGVFLIAYAVLRSVVEIFRGDYGELRAGGLTPAQLVSVIILVAGIALLVVAKRRPGSTP